MISIYINGERAVIGDGDIELITENPLFSSSESYTYEIEFPMIDSPENQKIFGLCHRIDYKKDSELMACTLMCGDIVKKGSLALLEVTDEKVKGQFLEGFEPGDDELTIDSLKVNELDLGQYPYKLAGQINPYEATQGTDNEVCMPWIAEGYTVVNNRSKSKTEWHEETVYLSWQPMLLPIMRKIASAAGYNLDLSEVADTYWEDAIICNSLPGVWSMPYYSSALPSWTVREFFDNVGLFMKGIFVYNHSDRKIKFEKRKGLAERTGVVSLDILDNYSATVTRDEEDADYLPLKRLRYPNSDNPGWKYLDCPGLLAGHWDVSRYNTLNDMLDNMGKYDVDENGHVILTGNSGPIYYAGDIDTYFIMRKIVIYSEGFVNKSYSDQYKYLQLNSLQPINVFAPEGWKRGDENEYEEMNVCPVIVDWAFEGRVMWLPCGSYTENDSTIGSLTEGDFSSWDDSLVHASGRILTNRMELINPSHVQSAISRYDEEKGNSGYYDKLYIGIRNPNKERRCPVTDVDIYLGNFENLQTFFRLGEEENEIDPHIKYEISFISSNIPKITSLFAISGQYYICRKLTVKLGKNGQSPLIKGEFYRLQK